MRTSRMDTRSSWEGSPFMGGKASLASLSLRVSSSGVMVTAATKRVVENVPTEAEDGSNGRWLVSGGDGEARVIGGVDGGNGDNERFVEVARGVDGDCWSRRESETVRGTAAATGRVFFEN